MIMILISQSDHNHLHACRDSWAVVTYAKLGLDRIIICKSSMDIYKIWLWAHKIFVKWIPGHVPNYNNWLQWISHRSLIITN